jgi:hypothetical protein
MKAVTTLGEERMAVRPRSEPASVEKEVHDLIERLLRANPAVSHARKDMATGVKLSSEQNAHVLEATLSAHRQAILRLAREIDELKNRN